MTSDIASTRYGRRGGGWLPARPATTNPGPRGGQRRRVATDARAFFHPAVIAQEEAHRQHCGGHDHPLDECSARPDPDRVAGWWDGRARMARARLAAGLALDDTDQEALTR